MILLFFVKAPPLLPLPLHWALLLVAAILSIWKKVGVKEIGAIVFGKTTVRSLLVIAAVIVFQRVLQVSSAFDALKTMDISLGLVVFFIFLVSFTVAFLTGVNTAYIAIAFPVLLPLIQHLPNYFYLSLYIYVIGYAGILVSAAPPLPGADQRVFRGAAAGGIPLHGHPDPHHDGPGDGVGADTLGKEQWGKILDKRDSVRMK